MRKALLVAAVALCLPMTAYAAPSMTMEAARVDGLPLQGGLSQDCLLQSYNTCSCWVWIFSDLAGAVWGTVLDPNDCPGGCDSGGAVETVWFWGSCDPAPPSDIGGIGVSTVDAAGCLTGELCNSGPLTITSCLSGDRWTRVDLPLCHVSGNPFAITVTWGADVPSLMRFATDNGIGNLFCSMGVIGTFPGCAATACTCVGWVVPAQATFIYVTDFNGDTILDDLCAIYGAPYPLAFPYFYPYGYLPNNLFLYAGLDCTEPTATEATSWGHVKALYE